MEEACGTGDAASDSSTSKAQCKQCGELSLQKDYIASQEYMVCENCGFCDEVAFSYCTKEWNPQSASKQYLAEGPSHVGRSYAPYDPKKARENYFEVVLRKMARKVNLSEHETTMLVEEGIHHLRHNQLGTPMLKRPAAGLVFLALQRQSRTIRYKEVAEQLGVSKKQLGKTVKALKLQPGVSKVEYPIASDEERIVAVIDKLPSQLPLDIRIKAKKMAIDIKELCIYKKIQLSVSPSLCTDCAILLIVLEAIEKKKRMTEWINKFAKNVRLKPTSLMVTVSRVRSILVTLAKEIPSLVSKFKSSSISSRNIQQYIPIIVQNKTFLMVRERVEESPEEEEEASAEDLTASCSGIPLMLPVESLFEDDSDGSLSDLDDEIKEYIATEKEVAKKQRMQSQ